MQYCVRCAYPENHALGISFDEQGICSGCRVHEEKDRLNWPEREKKLISILEQYKSKNSENHDCIIPVSGGKDSFFIVDLIKNKYKLNPLLVCFNRHYNTHAGIYNLEQIRTQIGCDIITLTADPRVTKKLIHYSLEKIGSIHWPYLAGSTVFPVQIAVKKKIPLIIWGVHQGVDQVGMFSHTDEVEMTRRYRKEHDLMGLEPEEIDNQECKFLHYPSDEDLYNTKVRGIYLGNYIRWDTKAQHEAMQKKYHYYTGPQLRTFDTYNDIDCQIYSSLHDEIKYRKHGYSKINDHVAREIRFGRITLEQGLDLIKKYEDKKSDVSAFCKWLGISVDEFWQIIDRFKIKPSEIVLDQKQVEAARLIPESSKPDLDFKTHTPEEIRDNPEAKRLLLRGGTIDA